MALISIQTLIDRAKARGFVINGNCRYAEIFAPEHVGPRAVWNFDSLYSTCDFVLSDRPGFGYGYNPWFNGPWHDGFVQSDDPSLLRLLAHPAMAD